MHLEIDCANLVIGNPYWVLCVLLETLVSIWKSIYRSVSP